MTGVGRDVLKLVRDDRFDSRGIGGGEARSFRINQQRVMHLARQEEIEQAGPGSEEIRRRL
jgi:hypothetical protein